MKNVVFIPNIDLGNGRATPYHYSVKSWQTWCDKHDVKLVEWTEPIMDHNNFPIIYQREWVFDILEHNDIDYNQVLIIDADTIVHPDCPNFFDLTERKLCGVHMNGSYDWVIRSIENYSKYFFNGHIMDFWKYIDCGFVIVNENHRNFFKQVIDFYNQNAENIRNAESTWHAGTDQTPVNFLIHEHNVDFKLLPYEYNMCDLFRKEVLHDDLLFTKLGWIYQYNGIPNNQEDKLTYHWMKKTYEHLYD